jgi:hypothetical protein
MIKQQKAAVSKNFMVTIKDDAQCSGKTGIMHTVFSPFLQAINVLRIERERSGSLYSVLRSGAKKNNHKNEAQAMCAI